MITNVLTVDVEEYFHAEVMKRILGPRWSACASRLEASMAFLLDTLTATGQRATFFTLGCVAERVPEIVQEIARRGHEVACHGYAHDPVVGMTPEEFRADVGRATASIARVTGKTPTGYRAPSFSLSADNTALLRVLVELGFKYDSSTVPTILAGARPAECPRAPWEAYPGLTEIPLAVASIGAFRVPVAGGIFFRMMPYSASRYGIRSMNSKGLAATMYFHPWEFDTGQPRPKGLGLMARIRHYAGINGNRDKFQRLCKDFRFQAAEDLLGEMASRGRPVQAWHVGR
jgi:polysaccharide deacetylase family protein (PEP-CTERM system associated)